MASEARNTAAAINVAISSAGNPYAPPQQRGWKGYWTRYWCFKSHKREKRIVPAARSEGASGPVQGWPPAPAGLAMAPPSSPASFINSSAQSPVSFSLSLSAVSAGMCSPGPTNTMFMIGPYAHETQLVSPPVFSTFTTEPSTAPFTPPPELAHLTTPSSPDVPFAQYIASSLEAKSAAREIISPLSTSNFASPCDTPASYTPTSYTPTSSQIYLGSPVGRLISSNWRGSSGQGLMWNDNHRLQTNTSSSQTTTSFPAFHPFSASTFDTVPFAALILPCDTNSKNESSPQSVILHTGSNNKDGHSVSISEISDISFKSERELDLGQINKSFSETLPLEQWNTCYFNSNASDHQITDDIPNRVDKFQESSDQHGNNVNNILLAGARVDYRGYCIHDKAVVEDLVIERVDRSPATLTKA